MAEPTGYAVSYSFAGWQGSNPTAPLPAGPIDIEFAGIEASLASLIDALGDVRRSDGYLQNEIVGLDQLDAQLTALLAGDPRVLVSDINPASFATQAGAEAGAAGDKLMSPRATRQAIEYQRAFASQAEAEAGASATVVLSPLSLVQALAVLRAYASQAEAEAGVSNAKTMTPLRVKQAIDALRPTLTATATLTWGGITTLAAATQTINVPGAVVGDRVIVGYPAAGLNDGLHLKAWVSSVNTVSLRAYNTTAGTITPTAATSWSVTVLH